MPVVARSLIVAIVLLASAVAPTTASEPIRDRWVATYDQVWGPCPDRSVVYAHLSYDITRWIFPDHYQSVVHQDATFTHSGTGLSIHSFNDYRAVYYLDPTTEFGTSGAVDAGSFAKIVQPGAGLVSNSSGRLIYSASGDIVGVVGVENQHGFDACAWVLL